MTKKRKLEAPLVGRITKVRRALWGAHVPAIGAVTQGRSLVDAAQMLKRVIEMMLRLDGHKVTVTVTMPEAAVNSVAVIAVTCDQRGLFEARAAEFKRLSAGVKGPISNPFFVAVRRDGITVVNDVEPKLPAKPTNKQSLENMREHLRRVMDAARRAGRVRRDAMIYRLGVMGVAAAATTKAFRAKHARIPWADVIALQELLGKPDRLLDHAALRNVMRETVPALMKALARPDLEVAEVIRLNVTPAEAKALREWGAKNLLPKPKKRKRVARSVSAQQVVAARARRQTGRT